MADSGVRPECPDCPAGRLGVFSALIRSPCVFRSHVVEARQLLPASWFRDYALALVRRGVLIRTRGGAGGGARAVDIAGVGCALPLASDDRAEEPSSGYAATRALVCLVRREVLEDALGRPDETSRGLIRMQALALERLERLADARARSSALERLGALLGALADTMQPASPRAGLPPDLQQRDFAALLGLRHETVCRALRELERRGAVERNDEGMAILDRAQLG